MKYAGMVFLLIMLAACQRPAAVNDYVADDYVTGDAPNEAEPVRFTQLEPPQPGDPIATLHTSMGDIMLRLFPQYAPMAVKNFTTLAESGHFDGALFYRAVPQFVIQAGIQGDRDTIWGGPFEPEYQTPLHHIRGAVGAAAIGGMAVSNFYIVQNNDMDYGLDYETRMRDNFREMLAIPDEVWMNAWGIPFLPEERPPVPFLEYYLEHGGMWRLDYPGFGVTPQKLALFGQVLRGMEVVDAIANVETTGPGNPQEGIPPNAPLEDIIILSVTLGEYE